MLAQFTRSNKTWHIFTVIKIFIGNTNSTANKILTGMTICTGPKNYTGLKYLQVPKYSLVYKIPQV